MNASNSGGTSDWSSIWSFTTVISPDLIVSNSSLSFGNVIVGTNSNPQSYTIMGSNLISNVVISASSNFQVSTSSGIGYTSILTLTPIGGNIDQIIYVRFSPTLVGSHSENITNSSSGITRYVIVDGTGVPHTLVEQIGSDIPTDYALYQNYPNPFNPKTMIEFDVPEKRFVSLNVYDAFGREIEKLVNRELNPSKYRVIFKANSLPSGIYLCVFNGDKFKIIKKMILIK